MALQKQNVAINFGQGLNLKSDPFQLPIGQFLVLENSIFTKAGLLQKRNGFGSIASLPDTTYSFIDTFNDNLLAVGNNVTALSRASGQWIVQHPITELQLTTLSLIRSSSNQAQVDTAIASNGLICTVFTNNSPSVTYNYVIADVTTGQNITPTTLIVTPSESPRVFVLGNYFIVLYSQAANLKYVAIPINSPNAPLAVVTLVTNYAAGMSQLAFDGVISNNNLYVAYNATDGGGAIRMTYLNSFLVRQTAATGVVVAAAKSADMMALTVDSTGVSPVICGAFYLTAGALGYAFAVSPILTVILAATAIITVDTVLNITLVSQDRLISVFYEVSNNYSYGTPLPTHFIRFVSLTQAGAPVAGPNVVVRSVGLASKAFIFDEEIYFLSTYSSVYQPSYFLQKFDDIKTANVIAKLAYSNGGGYLVKGLPSVAVTDTVAQMGYLIKDLIQATNKSQSPTSNTPVFTQTGINLVSFDFTTVDMNSAEIGNNLHLSGGILWAYDGSSLVEQGFNLWPDNVVVTTNTAGGNLADQTYYYQVTYEWTDNQGNIHRSAPSLAVSQVTAGGGTSTNTIKVPSLRLTYKALVKIVIYRWSTANQTYYQITSLTSPTLNPASGDSGIDSISYTDTAADSTIVGNSIIYTTGGVVEDIGPPATSVMTLFKSRLFLVDAEDRNLIWYSKQVIEATPVEMSDLFTLFVAPTIGAQGNTGPITALSSLDDKLIIFKRDAIYYEVGNGPDNTGANNDFSDPIFITSTVGSSNQNSIVFIPSGLLFQSDKGIWLLGRDLSTSYIGAPVESLTEGATVLSALTIPGTNQVRFTLDSGITLMYDYFFNQWGSFVGIAGLSSTLYQSMHTFIDSFGRVFQETPGLYLDGSNPVLMNFTTGWINAAGVQGYERAYYFYLLGTYLSPHKLAVNVAYDYNPSPTQTSMIAPINFSATWGGEAQWGSGASWGGPSNIEQWRVFLSQQKCEAFQINLVESYDSTFGVAAGAGFTLSGLNLVVGLKSSYPRLNTGAQTQVG